MDNTVQKESSYTSGRPQGYIKKTLHIHTKTAVIIAIVIVVGVLAYVYKGVFVAATVDGSPISRLAVIQKLEKTSGKGLLDSLINEKLISNEARAQKISVSDEEVNLQIKAIEDQVASQGGTLEAALTAEGMTMDDLKKQVMFQKEVEKLLGDKINVTDEEVTKYITDNKIQIPEGQEAALAGQVKNELRNQKLNTEASALLINLKAKANIQRFVDY